VQVKSRADQARLDDYEGRYRASGAFDRMFFVCHSPKGTLSANGRGDVAIWSGEELARQAVHAGLYGWLMERAA
jgi:hypothetical protein